MLRPTPHVTGGLLPKTLGAFVSPFLPLHLHRHRRFRCVLAATAVASTAALLAGCSSTPSAGLTAGDASTSAPKSLTMINPAPGTAAWQSIAGCFTAQAKKRGVAARVVGSPGDNFNTTKALDYFQQSVASGAGGIALNTAGGAATFESTVAAATKKGVKVATLESGDATKARTFDVGIDIPQYARKVAAQVASMPGTKHVAILTIALTGTPKIFNDTFKQAIASDPSIKLGPIVIDNGDVTKDADLAGGVLTAHPETNLIVTVNPGTTAGVVTAIKEHHALGKTSLIGISLDASSKAALQSGAASAIYVQRVCDVGTLAVDNLIAAQQGKATARDIPIRTSFATKSNYTTFDSGWN